MANKDKKITEKEFIAKYDEQNTGILTGKGAYNLYLDQRSRGREAQDWRKKNFY